MSRGDERQSADRRQTLAEEEMIVPHPFHVIMNLEQRHAEYLAESARDQRARLAEQTSNAPSRQRLADLLATLVVLVVLTLLIAAGATALVAPSTAAPLAAIVLL
jgi:hypothetical protein